MTFSALNSTCLQAFGETVTHSPAAGDNQDVTAIVQDASRLGETAPGVLVVVSATTSDFGTAPAKGDEITIGEVVYRVFSIVADCGGMIHLSLTK